MAFIGPEISAFVGLPFCGPPSILPAIVKEFTSDTSSDTIPQYPAHVRRSPAMRFALLTTVVAIGALACGKKADQTQTQTQSPPPAPPGAAATSTGPVVELKMTGSGSTPAPFEPSSITVPAGATT